MQKRWVFFDAVGTLFAVRGSVGRQYARVAGRFGCGATAGELERIFHTRFAAAPPLALRPAPNDADTLRKHEFQGWRQIAFDVLEGAGGVTDFDRCFEEIFHTFGTAACWELYPDTAATLRLLRSYQCGIGIISNFDSRLGPLLEDLGIGCWIDHVVTSSTCGAAKPDAGIFRFACKLAGCAAGDAWHVGDSRADDCSGASRSGMKPVLVDRRDRHTDYEGHRVRRLSQLPRLLGFQETSCRTRTS